MELTDQPNNFVIIDHALLGGDRGQSRKRGLMQEHSLTPLHLANDVELIPYMMPGAVQRAITGEGFRPVPWNLKSYVRPTVPFDCRIG